MNQASAQGNIPLLALRLADVAGAHLLPEKWPTLRGIASAVASLGAYPTDSYYDPERPAWLPYWLDTPTESALKWGAYPGVDSVQKLPPSPPPIAPPGAPQTSAELRGQWTTEQAAAASTARTQAANTNFFTALGQQLEKQAADAGGGAAWSNTLVWIAAGVAIVAGLMLIPAILPKAGPRRRRRR